MNTQAGVFAPQHEIVTLGGLQVGSPSIRRALVFSLLDGISATAMVALTETFGIAAAVSLKAPSMAIAVLGSAPLLLGSVGQYLLPAFADVQRNRKRYVLRGVALQATFLGFAALSGFLPAQRASWAYVACFVLAGVSANVTGAAWTSWMGDLVAPDLRARHFAWRSRVLAFVNLSCALLVGVLSSGYGAHNAPWHFFSLVFLFASLFRFVSLQMLMRQEEPKSRGAVQAGWRAKPSEGFRKFALANGFVQGAAAMSGPFFTVWYLRDLHFDYWTLAMAGCATVIGSIVSLPFWGKLADRIGNGRVLRLSGLMVCLVPIPYCFTGDYRVVWALNLFSGISWAGYNLASFNALLASSEDGDRTSLIAYASVVTGLIVFGFTLVGGFLATWLPIVFSWQLQTLFFLSGLLRFGAVALFPRLEPRGRTPQAEDLFHEMPGYRVGLGLLRNVFRAFRG